MQTEGIVLATEASFENTRVMKIQLVFLVLLVEYYGRENVIHYGSSRSCRVTSYGMESEIKELVYCSISH